MPARAAAFCSTMLVLKWIIAIAGMALVGWIVWRLLERQGWATDEEGNIIRKKEDDER